ncbi:MAG: hypothetical protein ER33_13295 [Cyanobium sp. CACIAM 14]|nr:MAG: hypothetical protein ER33_13295 [Cyanobium sp. CACIAM 14]
MTSNDMGTLRDSARLALALGELGRLRFNSVYPVVWNGGIAYYPSAVTERRGIQSFTFRGLQGQDILADLIRQARPRGLRVIPWFEFGFMAPPTSELARLHPGWLSRKRDGGTTSISAAGEVVWLNPFHPEVQAFITELVLEILTTYDADGIQFDDHMSLPREFGYDEVTRAAYRQDTKKEPPADPADPAWVKWRADRITAFMDQLRRTIRSRRPDAIVSVSPNYHDFAYKLQLQDWLTWVRRGIADEIVMQVYRPDLASFSAQLQRPEVSESRGRVPTAVGIMTGQRTSPVAIELIRAHALAARERGLGMVFFYYETLWEQAAEPAAERQAGFAELFPAQPRP